MEEQKVAGDRCEVVDAEAAAAAEEDAEESWMKGLTFSAPNRGGWEAVGGVYFTIVQMMLDKGFVEHKKLKG